MRTGAGRGLERELVRGPGPGPGGTATEAGVAAVPEMAGGAPREASRLEVGQDEGGLMKRVGDLTGPVGAEIDRIRTRAGSSADPRVEDGARANGSGAGGADGAGRGGGEGRDGGAGSGGGGGGGEPGDAGKHRGPGKPDCPTCRGVGWLKRDVEVGHPDFGRAYPCACLADDLARQRLARVRGSSNIAALGDMRFDTFTARAPGNSATSRRSLEGALEAARVFAEEPAGWLVLHGGYGCGKTHLAAAIVNARLAAGGSALFVVVPDLLDDLRATFAPGSDTTYDQRFEAVRDAPLLVLDDLGTQAPTAWAGEKLFQLLNHRYSRRLPTVITTNHAPEELDERLRSRLGDFEVVRVCEIRALDYRGGLSPNDVAISSLHHYDAMTFGTWDDRLAELHKDQARNLKTVRDRAREFAQEPSGWLVLLGDHGSGKTHLAAAIANARMMAGSPAVLVVVPDLLDHLRATFSPSSRVTYDKRFEEVRGAPLLVLDDLGTESATPWAREKLFQVLNFRYTACLPTVITTAHALGDIHARLRARMLDRRMCDVFEIIAPAYHGASPEKGSGGSPESTGSGRSAGSRGSGGSGGSDGSGGARKARRAR